MFLIQVSGSDSMTLLEVQTVMNEMTSHLRKNAHVLFGTGTDARLGSSLAVTVISSLEEKAMAARQAEEAAAPVKAAEPEAAPAPAPAAEEELVPSPLAAAVSAAAAAAIGEAAGIAASGSVDGNSEETATGKPSEPRVEPNIVPMEPVAAPEKTPVDPLADPTPAASAASSPEVEGESPSIVAMPQFSAPASTPEPLTNPIANAVQEASAQDKSQATPPPIPAETPAAVAGGDRVEAETDQSQTIALSRIVPGETTQRILNRPPKEEEPAKAVTGKVEPMPVNNDQLQQQQDVLHLEPVATKGRFAKGDPTIVDGEDLDVPTFLRKKG